MDIRGIEVTNQLRSAIRAKLLELGVRYDEELPDYILVMVVNKKSRQQMHEDLRLFLEDNTAPFVDWLHDQVLKKLQKVTIAKKKSTREFVPSVIIKQEEERKKRKTATSFLDDQTATEVAQKLLGKTLKEDKEVEKETATKLELALEPAEAVQKKLSQSSSEADLTDHSRKITLLSNKLQSSDVMKVIIPQENSSNIIHSFSKSNSSETELESNLDIDKRITFGKRSKSTEQKDDLSDHDCKKLKSSVCKPKVTSVVSVKNRLGIVSSRKKFEFQKNKANFDNRPIHGEQHQFGDANRKSNVSQSRNWLINDNSRRGHGIEIKERGAERANAIKQRLGSARDDKSNMNKEVRQKIKTKEKLVYTIKNRLGAYNRLSSSTKIQKEPRVKMQEMNKDRRIESRELEREQISFRGRNVKYRLGAIRKKFKATNNTGAVNFSMRNSEIGKDRDFLNLTTLDDLDYDDQSVVNMTPVKSHVVAVQKLLSEKTNRKKLQSSDKEISDAEGKEFKDCKVPSKVVVTPRPLKPLQPVQKRATQSLLLKAVAEANQSVVRQKNLGPSLLGTMVPFPKLSNSSGSVQHLSVHLDEKKRFVMENIRIELTTLKSTNIQSYSSHEVTDEQIGVVRSLFQQSNNNQRFLVTLNGYNDNVLVDENSEDNQDSLQMKVRECEELEPSPYNSGVCQQSELDSTIPHLSNTEDNDNGEDDNSQNSQESNVKNQNTEDTLSMVKSLPRGARKLSPLIYSRSRTSTPELSTTKFSTISAAFSADKKFSIESMATILRKDSAKRCRYWPNCTLGNTCAYYHPSVPCSVFPACKFGKKCTYLHPTCKFGLSCSKIGCVFFHPPTSGSKHRAKFTWRKQH